MIVKEKKTKHGTLVSIVSDREWRRKSEEEKIKCLANGYIEIEEPKIELKFA